MKWMSAVEWIVSLSQAASRHCLLSAVMQVKFSWKNRSNFKLLLKHLIASFSVSLVHILFCTFTTFSAFSYDRFTSIESQSKFPLLSVSCIFRYGDFTRSQGIRATDSNYFLSWCQSSWSGQLQSPLHLTLAPNES